MEKEGHKEQSKRPILFDTDEFDVDSFNVKPLSKGLGFHQERERSRTPRPQKPAVHTHKPLAMRSELHSSQVKSSVHSNSASEMFWDQTVSQSELSQFYQQSSHQKQSEENETLESQKGAPIKATFQSRFLAWTLDLVALSVICTALIFSFVTLAGMDIETLFKGMYLGLLELSVFGIGLFSLLYIFYFTILDMAASPGKSLLGLRVCGPNGERPKASQTLVRSVVSLLSLFLLGLPAILDFQSRLSESVVSKDHA